MNILLADGDSKIHLIIRMWLQNQGHEIFCTANGRSALELLEQNSYDCLITDVNMPLMNGIELIEKALKLPNSPKTIVVMTSRCDAGQIKSQIDNPKVHVFNKPFSPKVLTELIGDIDQQKVLST
ncbi:MAG: response regulator [Phycisphaerae bacterium]|nr:response regulator [Phycisphaerae bacterium]